jgi:DNA end-binding protein Ku
MSLHLAAKVSQEDIAPRNGSEEMTPRLVQKADIAKGYEYEKGKYAVVEPEELKNLRLAGKKTIEIAQFAKSKEIDPSLYEKPYFVVPKAGPQATAFAVIRQSMIDRQMVGIGEIVFSGRQHLIALAPPHDPNQLGMMLYTLRFATELRDPREFFKDIASVPIEAQQRNLANQLIDIWTQPFDANKFTDQYEAALRDLVEAKIKHLPAPAVQSGKKSEKVIDLMEALRRSIDQRNRSSPGVSPTTATEASTSLPKKPPAVTRAKTGSGRKRTST